MHPQTKEDKEANAFARAILIPEAELKKLVRNGTTNVLELARIFQVSTLVLRIRASEIGLRGHGVTWEIK